MRAILKLQRILCCKKGDEVSMSHAVWIVIAFVVGGILLKALSTGFDTEIAPSFIQSIKNLVTW